MRLLPFLRTLTVVVVLLRYLPSKVLLPSALVHVRAWSDEVMRPSMAMSESVRFMIVIISCVC